MSAASIAKVVVGNMWRSTACNVHAGKQEEYCETGYMQQLPVSNCDSTRTPLNTYTRKSGTSDSWQTHSHTEAATVLLLLLHA